LGRFRAKADDGIDALVAAEAARDARAIVLLTPDRGDWARPLASSPHVSEQKV
jgi:hypothetical protein